MASRYYFYGVDPGDNDTAQFFYSGGQHKPRWGQHQPTDDEKAKRKDLVFRILKASTTLNLLHVLNVVGKSVTLAQLEQIAQKLERDRVI